MNQQENLIDLVGAIYRKRKPIILVCIAAAILSAIASLLLPNYYTSTTSFYAASPDLAEPLPIGSVDVKKSIYGTDTDMDRLLSIAQSGPLADYLIEKFDLYERYEIDTADAKSSYKVRLSLSKLFKVQKNKFDALDLTVEDLDRDLAAKMANSARDKIDEIAQQVIKGSQKKVLEKYEGTIDFKESRLIGMIDSLQRLKKQYKIFNAPAQGRTYGEQLAITRGLLLQEESKLEVYKNDPIMRDSLAKVKAKMFGLQKELKYLNETTESFTSGVDEITKLERMVSGQSTQLSLDIDRYNQLSSAYNSPFSALHVIQEAVPPHIKSRPVRSLIVIGTTLLTFFLMLVWVVFIHQYRSINWRSVFSDE